MTGPMDLMLRETQVRPGAVPRELGGHAVQPGEHVLHGEQFLLRTACGIGFHYRRGHGVTVERGPDADPREEELFFSGSVTAAVAAINGLWPIHACAVQAGDRVVAFTGPSGAGKSTLAAALARRGFALFADDTLLLDLSAPGTALALPGHKRLKLLPDALELTGASATGPVGADGAKVYARPAGEPAEPAANHPLPLVDLLFLAEAPGVAITPLTGGARLAALQDDHHTQHLYLAANRPDRAARFAGLARLAGAVAMHRFARPHDPARFAAGVDAIEHHLRALPPQETR